MVTIKTQELKKFTQSAKNIKPNTMLPIYSYVKLVCKDDIATFYKSNGHSFLVYEIEADFKKDITLLIDEKVLLAAVSFTQGKEIKILLKGANILIDDSKKTLSCQSIDDNYPAIHKFSNEDKVFIDAEVVDALSLSKSHAAQPMDKAMRAWNTFVQLRCSGKKSFVAGANSTTSYFRVFDRVLPDFSLDQDVIGVISKYAAINYFSSGNYDCFDTGDMVYGFIKTESKCPDLSGIVDRFKVDTLFSLNRKEVISYCESVMQINDTSVPPDVLISDKSEKEVWLSYESMSGNVAAKEPVSATNKKGKIDEFRFQPQAMVNSLSCLSAEVVNFGCFNHSWVISSDEDKNCYTSVMELAKL